MQEKSKMFGKEEKDVFESLYNYASTKKKRQEQLSQKMYLTNPTSNHQIRQSLHILTQHQRAQRQKIEYEEKTPEKKS
jgi:hypothetical protein